MEIKESVLKLLDFAIVSSQCGFFPGDTNIVPAINDTYPIDIDCDILYNEKEDRYQVVVLLSINKDKKPGYSIEVQGVGFFTFNESIGMDEKKQYIQYSGLQMCIANVRSYVATITSFYPLGKFLFKAIDLNDFIKKKSDQIQQQDNEEHQK